jgi:hypothetical protein
VHRLTEETSRGGSRRTMTKAVEAELEDLASWLGMSAIQ